MYYYMYGVCTEYICMDGSVPGIEPSPSRIPWAFMHGWNMVVCKSKVRKDWDDVAAIGNITLIVITICVTSPTYGVQ